MEVNQGQWVTSPELRTILKISRTTFYRMLDAGLPTIGSGRLRRHYWPDVLDWYGKVGGGSRQLR